MSDNELRESAGGLSVLRVLTTVILSVTLIYVLVFNGLAGPGLPPFSQSTGNVSDIFFTCITPAGFAFSIWGVIYACLAGIVIYAIVLLFVKVDGVLAFNLGGPVTVGFMVTFIINLNINFGWLFAWDDINATASAILLLLVVITNYIASSLACYYFSESGQKLYERSRFHFWAGILVINGYGFYDGWTTIAAILNTTIFFKYQVGLELENICLGMLIFLLVAFLLWFIIENSVLATMFNPLFTHYVVLIWACTGVYVEQKDKTSDAILGLILANLVVGCVLLVTRIALIAYRNRGNRVYGNSWSKTSPTPLSTSDERY